MKHSYTTSGTCARQINFEIENGILTACEFVGGCAGNTVGVSRLIQGMKIDEAIKRLKGIPCGFRTTSCPDQLSIALEEAKNKINK